MILLVFIIAFVVSYSSMYIVSYFSEQNNNPISILKATLIIWGLSIFFKIFDINGFFGLFISTLVSMITFMKFLGFEATPSFFAGLLYSAVYSFSLLLIISVLH